MPLYEDNDDNEITVDIQEIINILHNQLGVPLDIDPLRHEYQWKKAIERSAKAENATTNRSPARRRR
jgi:hypothetical protein